MKNRCLQDVSFIIPLRVDSEEKRENLDCIIRFLVQEFSPEIIILEADKEKKYNITDNYPHIRHFFVEDHTPLFHRTRYLNKLMKLASYDIIVVWDTDILVPPSQIRIAAEKIRSREAVFCFPYEGLFYLISPEDSRQFRQTTDLRLIYQSTQRICPENLHSAKDVFLFNRPAYQEIGGENEYLYGSVFEHMERIKRLELLGIPLERIPGPLFCLPSSTQEDSDNLEPEHTEKLMREVLFICSREKEQLMEYIRRWEWYE